MITYFKFENRRSEQKYKNYKVFLLWTTTDNFVDIPATWSSVTLSITGFGCLESPIPMETLCGLFLTNEAFYEIVRTNIVKKKSTMRELNKIPTLLLNFIGKTWYTMKKHKILHVNFFTKFVNVNKKLLFLKIKLRTIKFLGRLNKKKRSTRKALWVVNQELYCKCSRKYAKNQA